MPRALAAPGANTERIDATILPRSRKLLPRAHGYYTPTWVRLMVTTGMAAGLALAGVALPPLIALMEAEANPAVAAEA